MLSIQMLKSSASASKYYEAADYYVKEGAEVSFSQWQGRGAAILGLSGTVVGDKFKALLDGKVGGQQLGRKINDEINHKCGWDLTLSAPKSVSVLALVGGDLRLLEAVQEASQETIGYLEENYAITRQAHNGKLRHHNEKNIVCASFLHTISRELDPQLHVHNVLLNMLQRDDGTWGSIESSCFYDQSMFLGQVFRSSLAIKAQNLGYEIETDLKTGFFEIKDVDRDVIRTYSKRREQIEEIAKTSDITNAKAMDKINLMSRKSKKEVSAAALFELWDKEAKKLHFNPKPMIECARQKSTHAPDGQAEIHSPALVAEQVVQICAKSLFEMEAVCSREAIAAKALMISLGQCAFNDIHQAIDAEIKNGKFCLSKTSYLQELLTTPAAHRKENYILKLMQQGQGAVTAVLPLNKAHQTLKSYEAQGEPLSTAQKDSILHIATTGDQIIGVQGFAGTGKTKMLQVATARLQAQGLQVIGLGAYNSTVETLQKDIQTASHTVVRFLSHNQKTTYARNTVLIVDEASQLNADVMADLLTHVRKTGSRLILVGDRAQIGAVEWGKPFNLMVKNGLRTSTMTDIIRQKNPALKEAVQSAIQHDYKKTLGLLKKEATVNPSSPVLMDALIQDYFAQTDQDRAGSFIVIPDHHSRDIVMKAIRAARIARGEVKTSDFKTLIYMKAGLNQAEKSDARFYKTGFIVEFNKAYKTLGIAEKERLKVVGIEPQRGEVILARLGKESIHPDEQADPIHWNPSKIAGKAKNGVEVYETKLREFGVGDQIIWTKTQPTAHLKNGDKGEIIGIVDQTLQIKFKNGVEKQIDTHKMKHFDYAYAATAHIAQGMTYDRVFVMAESWRKNLVNQKSFYVSISRARYQTKLYTDDLEKLLTGLYRRTGEKTSSIESFPDLQKDNTQLEVGNPLIQRFSNALKPLSEAFKKAFLSAKNSKTAAKGIEPLFKKSVETSAQQPLGPFQKSNPIEASRTTHPFSDDQKLSIFYAQKLSAQSIPIEGTVAERYLKETRGIDLKSWPQDVRFHEGIHSKQNGKKCPALLVLARNKEDKIQAVQAVYLDEKTSKKAEVNVQQQIFGPVRGALFSTASGIDYFKKTAIVCEGVEDALSLLKADSSKALYACLIKSNFTHLNLTNIEKHAKIILAFNHEGVKPSEMQNIAHLVKNLSASGQEVMLAQPDKIKNNYNDILRSQGFNGIHKILSRAIPAHPVIKNEKPNIFKEKNIEKSI
jgi:conjugative relaxase-like TrwC/TraI family protein